MQQDARFEDGSDQPLRLIARETSDLQVISALTQDAIFPLHEAGYQRKARRFALLLNRFRWEDRDHAQAGKRSYERVRSLLVIEDVQAVRSSGIDQSDKKAVLSLLSLQYNAISAESETIQADDVAPGTLFLMLSGGGEIAIDVEALELHLEDVSIPYLAPSRRVPQHDN